MAIALLVPKCKHFFLKIPVTKLIPLQMFTVSIYSFHFWSSFLLASVIFCIHLSFHSIGRWALSLSLSLNLLLEPLIFSYLSISPNYLQTMCQEIALKGLLNKNFCHSNKWQELHIHTFFSFFPLFALPGV